METIRAQVEAAELKSETWSAKLEKMVSSYRAEKSVVDAMRELLEKGVDGQMILDWNAFLEKLGTDIEHFGKDLEGYAAVQGLIAAEEKEVKELEGNANELKAEIEALKGEEGEITKSIRALRLAGIAEIEKVSSGAIANIKVQRSEAEGSIKNLTASGIKEVEGVRAEVSARVQKVSDHITEAAIKRLQEAEKVTEEAKANIDGIFEKVLEVGKELGKHESIMPLYKLISSGEGDPVEINVAMQLLCIALRGWLERNPPKGKSLVPNLENFSVSLREEIKSLREEKAPA